MTAAEPSRDLFTIPLRTITGADTTLTEHRGKVLLIVNVASGCGFTPQYAGLEALYREYRDRGLVVLGFPCNQFAGQEPGDEAEIAEFCRARYDVTFPMFAKIDVNGSGSHPLFVALRAAAPGLLGTSAIKWNFTKFLVDRKGSVRDRFAPSTPPHAIGSAIEALL
ncbi:MAG: glutathione peroxidase [Polyangiaceae bacterium]|nr:glutathione peroxidase [Polyangiaceae bacterium]